MEGCNAIVWDALECDRALFGANYHGLRIGSTLAGRKDAAKRLYMLIESGASSCLFFPSVV